MDTSNLEKMTHEELLVHARAYSSGMHQMKQRVFYWQMRAELAEAKLLAGTKKAA